jgi:hypothetical protein
MAWTGSTSWILAAQFSDDESLLCLLQKTPVLLPENLQPPVRTGLSAIKFLAWLPIQ